MKLPKTPPTDADAKKPRTLWDTIITSTPVVMTVLATLLAGLSNSELTQSLVYRGQAAQNQSKAGDQWGFFQAKKQRAAIELTSVEQSQNSQELSGLTPRSFAQVAERMAAKVSLGATTKPASEPLEKIKARLMATADGVGDAVATFSAPLPPIKEMPMADDALRKVFEAVKKDPMEEEASTLYGSFTQATLRDALRAADRNARAEDETLRPMTDAIKKIQGALDALAASWLELRAATTQTTGAPIASLGASDRHCPLELRQLAADFSAARQRFDAARHEREAKLNQQVAYLYEVAVRKANWQSNRYQARSKYFFYGMLGAQAAVLIATFSLAVRERSWMWSVAAAMGVMAVSFAGYVYLYT